MKAVHTFALVLGLLTVACMRQSSQPAKGNTQRDASDRAWIIWEEMRTYGQKASVQWEIKGSATKLEDCERERERFLAKTMDSLRVLQQRGRELGGVEEVRKDDDGTVSVNTPPRPGLTTSRIRLLCLPDTVDPRSPKNN